ncbi:hypothetical protein AAHC03_0594 [Spirometra sp. Aus1]
MADDKLVSEEDIESCFLFEPSHLGKERSLCALDRVQVLNGMVKVKTDACVCPVELMKKYGDYDEVIISYEVDSSIISSWRECIGHIFAHNPKHPKVLCVTALGMHAFGFSDLGKHFYEEDDKIIKPLTGKDSAHSAASNGNELVRHVVYPPLEDVLKLSWAGGNVPNTPAKRMPKGFYLLQALENLKSPLTSETLQSSWIEVCKRLGVAEDILKQEDFSSCCGTSLVAVNAIIGGIIAQEIIQGLSHRGAPKGNWYFVDGRTCEATVLWLPPIMEST